MTRDTLVEKIFSIINFQKSINHQDPDYIFIETMLNDIPENRFEPFYFFLNTTKAYHSERGTLLRLKLQDAVNDFIYNEKQAIWKKYDVEKKSDILIDKIMSLINVLRYKSAQEIENYIIHKNPAEITYLMKDERKKLFSNDEMEVIQKIGFKKLIHTGLESKEGLKIELKKEIKSFYTNKYLYEVDNKNNRFVLEFNHS